MITSLLMLLAAVVSTQEDIRARGSITVQRLILDAHVTDPNGAPMDDLRPANFEVKIDGRVAEVEAVDWIAATSDERMVEGEDRSGRLLVFFFQTDFQRASSRIAGQMQMIDHGKRFLERLEPNDLVAVVQHDSHLRIRQDFTTDRDKIARAIEKTFRIESPEPTLPDFNEISLMNNIELRDARDAASPEQALFVLGQALRNIDGTKSIVLFGWGLGRYNGGSVTMPREYAQARRMLDNARTAVFALDISDADYHSLEVGMQKAAQDTGGFYVKTYKFPKIAMKKLERTISGRYEIIVKVSNLSAGVHDVTIRLKGRRGHVMARSTYETH